MLHTVLDTGDKSNKNNQSSCSHEAYILVGEYDDKKASKFQVLWKKNQVKEGSAILDTVA